MLDGGFIQNSNCSFKISQPVRSVRFQEIKGCFNFGFWILGFGFWVGELLDVGCWMEFSIQHLKFKILPWSHGFSGVRQD
jgi:hypothetical protein